MSTNQENTNQTTPTKKGILANVAFDIAEKFKEITKAKGSNPSRTTRQLIEQFVEENE